MSTLSFISSKTLTTVFIVLLWTLVFFGLLIIASAGAIDGQRRFDSSYYYVSQQITRGVFIGSIAFTLALILPESLIIFSAVPVFISTIILLFLTLFSYFAPSIKGASRWLYLGPVSFQPSEFIKIGLILYLSAWLGPRIRKDSLSLTDVLPVIIVAGIAGLILILQPDIGTLGVVSLILLSLLFFVVIRWSHLGGILTLGIAAVLVLSLISPYRLDRLRAFLDPSHDPSGASYHITQALNTMEGIGWFGRGYGNSIQKVRSLPEPVGDSVFAVFAEETGFVGSALLFCMLLSLSIVSVLIALREREMFWRLLCLGFAAWVFFQTVINVGAITGILPFTGVPLPFISFGSSSLIALLGLAGLVARTARRNQKSNY